MAKGQRLSKIFKNIEDCPPEYTGKMGNRFIDLKGKTYNYLTVLYLIGSRNRRAEWLCKCNNCGKYVIVNSHNLRTGHTKSCGCLISEKLRKDLTGKQFGYLKVLKYAGSKYEMSRYVIKCTNCGKVYEAYGHGIEKQYSCGCIKSKNANIILQTLKNSSIPYIANIETEKIFNDCIFKSYLKFDFYIPKDEKFNNQEILIEYDGEQHYKPTRFNSGISDEKMYKNFISNQVRDWYKDFYCIQNDIPLIRVKYCTKKNPSYKDIWSNSEIIGKSQRSNDKIQLFDINQADFVNYKDATFNIYAGISCDFKCCKNNPTICQNNPLLKEQTKEISIQSIINDYLNQDISHSITFQGLEVLENIKQLLWFIYYFRQKSEDDIIIWTGFTKEECEDFIYLIKEKFNWKNIIIKFGRYIPNQAPHYDEVLGVNLASDNQYAERIC